MVLGPPQAYPITWLQIEFEARYSWHRKTASELQLFFDAIQGKQKGFDTVKRAARGPRF